MGKDQQKFLVTAVRDGKIETVEYVGLSLTSAQQNVLSFLNSAGAIGKKTQFFEHPIFRGSSEAIEFLSREGASNLAFDLGNGLVLQMVCW